MAISVHSSHHDRVENAVNQMGLAHRLTVALWIFDIDNARIIGANEAACRLWAAKNEEELCARDLGADMSSSVIKRLKQYQSDFSDYDKCFAELWTLYPKGSPRNVMVNFSGFTLSDGRMAMLCEVMNEVEDAPQNLRSAEALLHTDVIISLFGEDGSALYLNPAARNGFASPSVKLRSLFVERADHSLMLRALKKHGEHRFVVRVNVGHEKRWYDLSAKRCADAATGQSAILVTAFDVSELKEARDIARNLADRDQLTGLHNRAYLQAHLEKLRDGQCADLCAIVFCDVDRFKMINDRYGHDAGDCVLREIASRTVAQLRKNDVIARLGGDEFVFLFENVTGPEDVIRRTQQTCDNITSPVSYGDFEIDLGMSVGIAMFTPMLSDFDDVLRQADIALYSSKKAGRDRVTLYTEKMGLEAKARDSLEISLKDAIANDDFVLHYQPRLDIKTGKIVAVEGLVRWAHPIDGLIMPDDFIPLCEETGLIDVLGRRVLEMGVAQAIAWQRAGLEINLSLNASPRQFNDDRILQTLSELAASPEFPIGRIEIEITENVLIGDPAMIAQKLKKITNMGYRIAIDDFGTGFSNLSSISQFPLTCIKIDRSFISKLPASGPIVRLIITLGQQLGATVVSEGVETAEQLAWLAEHDCGQAQGYFITGPLPSEDFVRFIKNKTASKAP